ncbi:potassium channel family protein [Bacillaceae bacterium S4-13-58]
MRYSFLYYYFRIPVLVRLLLTVLSFMILFGIIIHWIEPSQFPTIFDGIWWAFVTGSTVGYGDYVPLSNLGRIIAIFLILTGGGVVTFYMATISASTLKRQYDLSEGSVDYHRENHFIIIGWNEKARRLIEKIEQDMPSRKMVLIDQTLDSYPYQQHPVHFVKGDPSRDSILKKANIQKASTVIITADQSKNEGEADQQSILCTIACRGLNPNLPIFTEILSQDQITNAYRAGATKVLSTNSFMSELFYHEIQQEHQAFRMISGLLESYKFLEKQPTETEIGQTFGNLKEQYRNMDQTILGISKGDYIQMNPPSDVVIENNHTLFILVPNS